MPLFRIIPQEIIRSGRQAAHSIHCGMEICSFELYAQRGELPRLAGFTHGPKGGGSMKRGQVILATRAKSEQGLVGGEK